MAKPPQNGPNPPRVQHRKMSLQEALKVGIQLHRAGRLDEAEKAYRQIAAAAPNDHNVFSLLGVIAHQRGDNKQAIELLEKSLSLKPNNAETHNNIGTVRAALGDLDGAIEHYRTAIEINPDDLDARCNLGGAFLKKGAPQQALAHYETAAAANSSFANAHLGMGEALRALSRPVQAAASFRKAIRCEAAPPSAYVGLIDTLIETNSPEAACKIADKALAKDASRAEFHFAQARAQRAVGELGAAAASYKSGLKLAPKDLGGWNNLANICGKLNRPGEAVRCFDRAIALAPQNAILYSNKANALLKAGDANAAEHAYRTSLALDPALPAAHVNFVGFLEQSNRLNELRTAVAAAKRAGVNHPQLALSQAKLLMREEDFENARKILQNADAAEIKDVSLSAARLQALGNIADRLGETDAAFNYFVESHAVQAQDPLNKRFSAKRHLQRIDLLEQALTADWVASWRAAGAGAGRRDPGFLFSFPRSGTTLVDSMLRGHPDLATTEEKEFIAAIVQSLVSDSAGYAGAVRDMEDDKRSALRATYFAELDAILGPEGKRAPIVIDRNPMHTINVTVIHRLFPEAPLVFVARHPCDTVLSCFMQLFNTSDQMANFHNLEGTVRLYDRSMAIWEKTRSLLPLRVHVVRYEDLIENAEKAMRALLEFLGANWNEGVLNHEQSAKARTIIRTASYAQVTEPLYKRAKGRWERYRAHLEPYLPTLLKWAEKFGYSV